MKIGINARFLIHPYTGIGQYTRHLLEALAALEPLHEYFIFTPEAVDLPLPDHMHLIRVPERGRSASWRKANWEHVLIPREMAKWKVDLAHFLYPANPFSRLPIPTVVTLHDVIPWKLPAYRRRWRSRLYHLYAKWALRRADHVIAVSEFTKKEALSTLKLKEKNTTVIHLAPPLPVKKSVPVGVRLRKDFLLYVGGYDERKNVPLLVEAFEKHVANAWPVDLILVGAKNQDAESWLTDRYVEKVAGRYVIRPKGNVIATGPLTPEELGALYGQAKALVHASRYEGFNLPVLEALSYGLPVVASDIPVNREVAGEHALFVDPSSVDAVGTGMVRLLSTPSLQRELSEKGCLRAADFSWEKHAQETVNVYNLFT